MAYVEELGAVDTSAAKAAEACDGATVSPAWRADVVVPGLSRDDALGGAPRATGAGFAVPGFVSAGPAGAARGGR